MGGVRLRGGVHRDDGRVGLHDVGQRLVLPAVLLRWVLPRLLPHVRVRRVVQPVDGRLHARRRRVRSVRRRRLRLPLQPGDRHVFARRGGVRARRRARRGPGVESENGDIRADAPGCECLRQLGIDLRTARRSVGVHVARDEPRDRHDDARDAGQRRRRRGHPSRTGRRGRCRADGRRRRVRGS